MGRRHALALTCALAAYGLAATPAAQTGRPAPHAGVLPWQDTWPAARVETRHLVAATEPVRLPAHTRDPLTLVLHVTPRAGMRVYAHDVTGYRPLTLDLDTVAGVTAERPVYPPSAWYVFPPTLERSRVYQAPVTLRQTVALTPPALQRLGGTEGPAWTGTIRYQACDDTLCYRPAEARVGWYVAP